MSPEIAAVWDCFFHCCPSNRIGCILEWSILQQNNTKRGRGWQGRGWNPTNYLGACAFRKMFQRKPRGHLLAYSPGFSSSNQHMTADKHDVCQQLIPPPPPKSSGPTSDHQPLEACEDPNDSATAPEDRNLLNNQEAYPARDEAFSPLIA